MADKKRLKYEKPVSIDMGRVAPVLGDTCSVGDGAEDCPAGMNNASVPVCQPAGASADNDCRTGTSAGTFCWPTGSSAAIYCLAGDGFGAARAPMGVETESYEEPLAPNLEPPSGYDVDVGTDSIEPESSEPEPL